MKVLPLNGLSWLEHMTVNRGGSGSSPEGERKTGKGYRQLEPVSILVISKHFQNKYLSKGAAMHFFHLPACRIFAV